MPAAKIQLRGQFAIDHEGSELLSLQIVRQLQDAMEKGHVGRGARLPSTRALARALGVSRNTVLTAYEELTARGFLHSRPGAGMYAVVPPTVSGFDLRTVMRDAQYPARTITLQDPDENPLSISY